jgi:hypothetical protein
MWMVLRKVIGRFIEKHQIPAVPQEHLPLGTMHAPVEKMEATEALPFKPYPFPGGIHIPHLHLKGELYLLNRKQWKEFVGDTIRGFQEKMERANNITFYQLMEISEAVSTLT